MEEKFLWTKVGNSYKFLMKGNVLWWFGCHTFVLQKSIHHFNFQLTHTLKKVELFKNFKISKTAPTCFGLQGNHHQGATIST